MRRLFKEWLAADDTAAFIQQKRSIVDART
jgi:hypothetical protein